MSADHLISVKDLKKYYNGGAIKALDGVSIDIDKGEVVVIDENFGVRVTEILSPQERVNELS